MNAITYEYSDIFKILNKMDNIDVNIQDENGILN